MKPLKLTAYFFLLLTMIYLACKKTDSPQSKPSLLQNRFFTISTDAPKEIKAIAEAIKKQNDRHNYLSSIIKKSGYPRWDKARIVNFDKGTITGRGSEETSGEIVYIPFARDSDEYVNSLLAVKMNASDTVYRMLHDYNYRKFGYDTTDQAKWSARDVFNLFASFDNTVFGHTKFIIKDGKIFGIDTASGFVAELLTKFRKTTAKVSSMEPIEICATYTICPSCDGYVRAVKESVLPGQGCCNPFNVTFCNTYWADVSGDGGGGSGGGGGNGGWTGSGSGTGDPSTGGGSGGGGGGEPWYGGSDPCAGNSPTPRLSNVAPVDGCGNGWQPVDNIPTYNYGSVQDVLNNLTNPCLNQVYNHISDSKYKNTIITMIREFQRDHNITVDLENTSTLPDNIYGETFGDINNLDHYTVQLNSNILSKCSEETIAATFFHEVVHAYLKYHLTEWDFQNRSDHQQMLESYFNDLVSALMESYPNMSYKDAVCVTFIGIESKENDPAESKVLLQAQKLVLERMLQRKYPADFGTDTENKMIALANAYDVNGNLGTRTGNCQ